MTFFQEDRGKLEKVSYQYEKTVESYQGTHPKMQYKC